MLNNWFYSHSTWEVAALVCSVLVIIPILGLYVAHRFIDWETREKETGVVGLTFPLCSGIFAVVLAFVAVGTYEAMDRSSEIASDEANSLSALLFNSAGLPDALAIQVRADVNRYIDVVTESEWPSQRAYHMEPKYYEEGWAQIHRISLDLADFEPSTPGQATVKTDMMRLSNELFSARRARLLAANAHLPNSVWQMLVFGLVLNVIFLYLFGANHFKIHIAVTALTMLMIGLVFTLTIALDYPFRGELSVDDDAYIRVKEVAAHSFDPVAETPGIVVEAPSAGGKSENHAK